MGGRRVVAKANRSPSLQAKGKIQVHLKAKAKGSQNLRAKESQNGMMIIMVVDEKVEVKMIITVALGREAKVGSLQKGMGRAKVEEAVLKAKVVIHLGTNGTVGAAGITPLSTT